MVDIFKKQICNYCKRTQCEEEKLIETKIDGINIYKCMNYEKDPSKINIIEPPLPVTAKRDYVKYCER